MKIIWKTLTKAEEKTEGERPKRGPKRTNHRLLEKIKVPCELYSVDISNVLSLLDGKEAEA